MICACSYQAGGFSVGRCPSHSFVVRPSYYKIPSGILASHKPNASVEIEYRRPEIISSEIFRHVRPLSSERKMRVTAAVEALDFEPNMSWLARYAPSGSLQIEGLPT